MRDSTTMARFLPQSRWRRPVGRLHLAVVVGYLQYFAYTPLQTSPFFRNPLVKRSL